MHSTQNIHACCYFLTSKIHLYHKVWMHMACGFSPNLEYKTPCQHSGNTKHTPIARERFSLHTHTHTGLPTTGYRSMLTHRVQWSNERDKVLREQSDRFPLDLRTPPCAQGSMVEKNHKRCCLMKRGDWHTLFLFRLAEKIETLSSVSVPDNNMYTTTISNYHWTITKTMITWV